ncbi:MAG: hypothetical protein J5800_05185 [Spirochaetales bacterium]|nr:hypothetical protein [Spirochaetales bacterium]
MSAVPGKTKKPLLIVLIVLLTVASALALVYYLVFPTFTIVSDSAFSAVLSKPELHRLGLSMAAKGIRLKIEAFENDSFYAPESFSSRLGRVKGKWVLLGPTASAYSAQNGINVRDILENSVTIGIHADPTTGLFDCTLVSDVTSGWIEAASAVSNEMSKTSRNTALVYENDVILLAQDIESCFQTGWLSVYEDDGQSRLFVSTTLSEMDRQNIVIALCPFDSRLNDFFKSPSSLSWVVDYRFAPVVPQNQLYGIVIPDFKAAFEKAMKITKGSTETIALEYRYEKL